MALTAALTASILLAAPGGAAEVSRIGDAEDVVDAAIALSQLTFEDGAARYVVLGRDDDFPDNLAATPLAGANGPILYTDGGAGQPLRASVRDEIARATGGPQPDGVCDTVDAEEDGFGVYLLGSENAVSAEVETELAGLGYCVFRFAGASRFETAASIAGEVRRIFGSTSVIVTRADDWADAATAGAWAARTQTPIIITSTNSLHPAAAEFLQQSQPEAGQPAGGVFLIGSTAAIAQGVQDEIDTRYRRSDRIAGAARDLTATAIYEQLWPVGSPADQVALVNGYGEDGWAYAFAAAGQSATSGIPQLLTRCNRLADATVPLLQDRQPALIDVVAPSSKVADQVLTDADLASQGMAPTDSGSCEPTGTGGGGGGGTEGGVTDLLPTAPADEDPPHVLVFDGVGAFESHDVATLCFEPITDAGITTDTAFQQEACNPAPEATMQSCPAVSNAHHVEETSTLLVICTTDGDRDGDNVTAYDLADPGRASTLLYNRSADGYLDQLSVNETQFVVRENQYAPENRQGGSGGEESGQGPDPSIFGRSVENILLHHGTQTGVTIDTYGGRSPEGNPTNYLEVSPYAITPSNNVIWGSATTINVNGDQTIEEGTALINGGPSVALSPQGTGGVGVVYVTLDGDVSAIKAAGNNFIVREEIPGRAAWQPLFRYDPDGERQVIVWGGQADLQLAYLGQQGAVLQFAGGQGLGKPLAWTDSLTYVLVAAYLPNDAGGITSAVAVVNLRDSTYAVVKTGTDVATVRESPLGNS